LAQAPAAGAGGIENSKDYKDTQDVINKTQAKIDQLRRDNDVRAKEIEAIANRVGDVISTMSSQGSDNTSLRSEMSKLAGQLDLERETTKALRGDLAKANAKLNTSREKELEDKLRSAENANREAEKRLSAALESIAGHARINRQLVSDIEGLQKDLDAARKETELIRRLRSSNPSQPLPPSR
jgi:chromosome segregation ATPase